MLGASILFLFLLLAAITLEGCGSSGSSAPPSPPAPSPQAVWPPVFFANFTETFVKDGRNSTGYYALDLTFNGSKGAQAIYRSDGTDAETCGFVHQNTPCIQLALDGQRYLIFPEKNDCCICCSWAQGCGPIGTQWTNGALYKGRQTVNGVQCDDFEIDGGQANRLMQTTDGKKICEVNQGMTDRMVFDLDSFVTSVDPMLFAMPEVTCSRQCGAVGVCMLPESDSNAKHAQGLEMLV
eukprot:gnl/MRDRNA2_/MRDRNA2_74307_c0_seq1.p1 gnl/MRDRNA2_/MRDRNA2_74307_c0~~gnl/MRDRNA2_/MRDRNA2_74307_c0_seq1.p1  ORF type:complete len:238 (+),score=26.24 gnl/MRDRNA2_/MRDRNA2_74307_c0_seq1:66-779(+)